MCRDVIANERPSIASGFTSLIEVVDVSEDVRMYVPVDVQERTIDTRVYGEHDELDGVGSDDDMDLDYIPSDYEGEDSDY